MITKPEENAAGAGRPALHNDNFDLTPYRPRGIYSALWIPTDAQGGVDEAALDVLVGFQRSRGIDGILALGSTGEFPRFDYTQRRAILKAVMKTAGDLPVIANVTDINPRVAVKLGRFARSLGVKAVALMPPMFFPLSSDDQLAYFLHVAEAVDHPVMLYNFPELTGKRIAIETVAAFAERAPLCAIKQSGGEFAYHRELVALGREKEFAVMSGADTRLPEAFALGAAGAIGGLVNIVPDLMTTLYHRYVVEGRPDEVGEIAAQLVEVGRIVDQLAFPLNVAAGLNARGLPPGVPKMIVSGQSRVLYDKIAAELTAQFAHWRLASIDSAA
jgi:4-hydroxy-tetrahydrodipicolinate synthase